MGEDTSLLFIGSEDRGWKEFCLVMNRFLFYDNISEIYVYNKIRNCPWHDFKSFFFVCYMSFKFQVSTKQYKMLRVRDINARFPHSENCPAPVFTSLVMWLVGKLSRTRLSKPIPHEYPSNITNCQHVFGGNV